MTKQMRKKYGRDSNSLHHFCIIKCLQMDAHVTREWTRKNKDRYAILNIPIFANLYTQDSHGVNKMHCTKWCSILNTGFPICARLRRKWKREISGPRGSALIFVCIVQGLCEYPWFEDESKLSLLVLNVIEMFDIKEWVPVLTSVGPACRWNVHAHWNIKKECGYPSVFLSHHFN